MADTVPLSVVILTKNESSRLADCLRSVEWADERLVVDDESTDTTVALAETMGAKVLRRKMDIEGRHRNWANAQTRHEWVLSLDADERVTPELALEIRQVLSGTPPYETYAVPRRNYIGDRWIRHGGWYPSAQLKMFKKSIFKWEETTVHPRAFSDKPCGLLRGDLMHYSYRDRADFIQKQDRHTTLEAQKWIADRRAVKPGKALWRTVDRFLRSYVLKQGFRDGGLGWFVAVMAGHYQWTSYVKYLALKRAAGAATDTRTAPAQTTAAP
jgi:glycosyltransferase involved in cell wall biosynthesis